MVLLCLVGDGGSEDEEEDNANAQVFQQRNTHLLPRLMHSLASSLPLPDCRGTFGHTMQLKSLQKCRAFLRELHAVLELPAYLVEPSTCLLTTITYRSCSCPARRPTHRFQMSFLYH